MVLGVPQTLRYFEQMQERIVSFVTEHSKITARRFTQLMHNTGNWSWTWARSWMAGRPWRRDS